MKTTLEGQKRCLALPSSAFDLLGSMLQCDPTKRTSAAKTEDHPFFFKHNTATK
ncbi:MAG: hypothetical protein EXX96DRAFT_623213 [Benjaminiella poitrasii]|nr:MAG: hypothetical protein EXX96DRAFT_623213 [Benjaminiella poitrasii]